ncbi:MAG: beta-propeller domain-containing protein [Nanoarchaeota archaeon]
MTRINLFIIVGVLALLVAACTQTIPVPSDPGGEPINVGEPITGSNTGTALGTAAETNLSAELTPVATQELKKFASIAELEAFLARSQGTQDVSNRGSGMAKMAGAPMMDMAVSESMGAGGASDYSETNVQVEGVDEGDFVKNDGKYIYMIQNNRLLIIDAYPGENAKIISETKMKNIGDDDSDYYNRAQAKQMFIDKDRLTLFVQTYEKTFRFNMYDIQPQQSYRTNTHVLIYDISNRKNPEVIDSFIISGSYYQSRMIDGVVYVVTQEGAYYSTYLPEPMIRTEETRVMPPIYYFDNPEESYQFNTLASIDVRNDKLIDSMTLMLGYSNTLMVSTDNIYIAYQKQNRWCWWGCYRNQYDKDRFYEIVVPELKGELKDDIMDIIDEKQSESREWQQISEVLTKFFEKAASDEDVQDVYEDMFSDISDALEEYDVKKAFEQSKTIIQKIGIDDGQFTYNGKGEVYGRLLNQFSLDEYKENLRVATTVNIWAKKRIQHNNVYVLDKNMNTIGELEGIAPDESIYSTRFMGDRLYMVTFRRMDPFFVIDLSNPKNPKVAGELKIPGYSDYLHPYDANHVIGVGKETDTNSWGGTSTGGVKIALFDVTDVTNPKLVDKVEIGTTGSDSPVLHDHKAFLFSLEKNLLVIPVTEVTERYKKNQYSYSNSIWNGAYVFHVDANGFEELGKIRHSSSTSDYVRWWNQATVQRSLYMDNLLYTISTKYIKVNDLDNDLEEVNEIDLPYADKINDPWYGW